MKPYRNIQEAIWDFSDRIERLEAALKASIRRLDSIEESTTKAKGKIVPTYILKVAPEKDLYIGWSTVTDSIHFWGTREEIIDLEIEEAKRRADEIVKAARAEAEQRIDRADETGTSAMWGNPPAYGFKSSGMVWQQEGILPRERIEEMLATYNTSIGDFEGKHLLKPFEDD